MDSVIVRDAATLILIRDSIAGVEVCMLKRNIRSDFVGGAFVFPGGRVDEDDIAIANSGLVRLDGKTPRLDLPERDDKVEFYVAAVRECFEEAGILIAKYMGTNKTVEFESQEIINKFQVYRNKLNSGEITFKEFLERENLYLPIGDIAYISHWITPVGPPKRYDTRFFVAAAPSDQVLMHDNFETVESVWIRPVDAFKLHEEGKFELIFPTIKNLEVLNMFKNSQEVLDFAINLETVPAIEPKLIEKDGQVMLLIPGDEGYE